jgi:hypothetical protein
LARAEASVVATIRLKCHIGEGATMDLGVPTQMALFYILWVLIPIIPAVFIYWLFPKDKINVGGPVLSKLTFSASGAFAAYVIVFGLTYPIIEKNLDSLGSLLNPSWTVNAKVILVDEAGHVVTNTALVQGLAVQLSPDFYWTSKELVTVSIPELKNSLPNILLSIPKFGSSAIDWKTVKVNKDGFHKTIEIVDPIEIHKLDDLKLGSTMK